MYHTKTYQIGKIPVLEMTQEEISQKPAPLLIFYHGWTSRKEEMESFGRILVKSGYRVVFPDVPNHGMRFPVRLNMWDDHYIFTSIMAATDEFGQLAEYYLSQQLVAREYIAVGGVSMGGFITNAILRKYPFVKIATSMMGSAKLRDYAEWVSLVGMDNLLEASTYFYPERPLPDERVIDGLQIKEANKIQEILPKLEAYDLSMKPEAICYRPVYYWQAKPDKLVPCRFLQDFCKQITTLSEAKNVYHILAEEGGHILPLKEIKRVVTILTLGYEVLAGMNESDLKQGIPKFWQKIKEDSLNQPKDL